MTTDVVVIGGGPAGSSAAIRLARTGRRVRLYEKARFPRPKLCGGFLSPEALKDLEEFDLLKPLRDSGAVPINRTVVASSRGTVIESPLSAQALSICRDVLDNLLLSEARRSGVDVREGGDGFRSNDSAQHTVIAAGRLAGAYGEVRDVRLTPWYASPRTNYFGIQATFKDVDRVTDQVELDVVESGYVGLAPTAEGVNVCALTTQETLEQYGPSLDQVLSHFTHENPVLQAHLRDATRLTRWMSVGPVRMGIRHLANGNTFYVGDAACVVDPFVGEGMAMGLYSSRLLQQALDQPSLPPAQAYAKLWRKAFIPALRWNAVMRMLYGIKVLQEPVARILRGIPKSLAYLAELTRYRQLEEAG